MKDDPTKILGRLEAGTLLRHEWGDGRERACLLAAMAPQCAASRSARACPAEVMPFWLAELTPLMNDKGSTSKWEPFVRRYAAVAARWHRLDAAGWRRALLGSLIAILEVARKHDPSGSCKTVIALCREEAPTEDPRWEAAVAADAVNAAVTRAARMAARIAAYSAREAEWVARIAACSAGELEWGVWDRMTDGILSAIEAECEYFV